MANEKHPKAEALADYFRSAGNDNLSAAARHFGVSHTTIANRLAKLQALGLVRKHLPAGRKRKTSFEVVEK